jgi:hypothetical protein
MISKCKILNKVYVKNKQNEKKGNTLSDLTPPLFTEDDVPR